MIRILEQGNLPLLKVCCSHCNSLLEFNPSEDEIDSKLSNLYSMSIYRYIICPYCKNKICTHIEICSETNTDTSKEDTERIYTFIDDERIKTRGNW